MSTTHNTLLHSGAVKWFRKDSSHQYATPFYPACTTLQVQWDHSVTHFWERERTSERERERGGIEGGDEHWGKIENIRCLVLWCLTEMELTWALEANSSFYPVPFKLVPVLLQTLPKNRPADLAYCSAKAPVLPWQAKQKSNPCFLLNSTKVSRPLYSHIPLPYANLLSSPLNAAPYLALAAVCIQVTNPPSFFLSHPHPLQSMLR